MKDGAPEAVDLEGADSRRSFPSNGSALLDLMAAARDVLRGGTIVRRNALSKALKALECPTGNDCCPDWPVQSKKIDAFIVLQSVRAGRDLFDGIPYRFCPWCGRVRPNAKLSDPAK